MAYLLDTNTLSALRRIRRQEAAFQSFASQLDISSCFISAITYMELEIGTAHAEARDPAFAADLRRWIDTYVLNAFGDRIIAFGRSEGRACAQLLLPGRKPHPDAMIAATALVHGLIVITRNTRDFAELDVKLLNPWQA